MFHQGELSVQKLAGKEEVAQQIGKMISDKIHSRVALFLEKKLFFLISSKDQNGNTWISIIFGQPNFVTVENDTTVTIHLDKVISNQQDLILQNLKEENQVGLLFIELETRRRFRVNGSALIKDNYLNITINEAYGNCPKYIQSRSFENNPIKTTTTNQIEKGYFFPDSMKNIILKADTFFVGSSSKAGKMDASHRGGNHGFVEFADNQTLKIPDYQGNNLYNTLGNIYENPGSALLFYDFETNEILQLSGTAELLFEQHAENDLTKSTGTGRFWLFKIEKWIFQKNNPNMGWILNDTSPFNP